MKLKIKFTVNTYNTIQISCCPDERTVFIHVKLYLCLLYNEIIKRKAQGKMTDAVVKI